MNAYVAPSSASVRSAAAIAQPAGQYAHRALAAAVTLWFVVAALGQLFFVTYVAAFYGGAAWRGQPQAWNAVLGHGYVAGEPVVNAVMAAHLGFAIVVTVGGLLQLVPALRRHWPRFHRWNGRVYAVLVVVQALSGLTVIATRGAIGDASQTVAITLSAVLLLLFAALAWRSARARRFEAHRRWALRLFLVANGGWFFRLGLSLWIVANRGPVGFDPETFSGPFLTLLAFGEYLVPLALLQLYLRAQAGGRGLRWATAATLGVAALLTAAGVASAGALLWLPRLH